jgi:hypothetical protein
MLKDIILSLTLVQEHFVFYEVKISVTETSSNHDITDDITIKLMTSNNNKAKNSCDIVVKKLRRNYPLAWQRK